MVDLIDDFLFFAASLGKRVDEKKMDLADQSDHSEFGADAMARARAQEGETRMLSVAKKLGSGAAVYGARPPTEMFPTSVRLQQRGRASAMRMLQGDVESDSADSPVADDLGEVSTDLKDAMASVQGADDGVAENAGGEPEDASSAIETMTTPLHPEVPAEPSRRSHDARLRILVMTIVLGIGVCAGLMLCGPERLRPQAPQRAMRTLFRGATKPVAPPTPPKLSAATHNAMDQLAKYAVRGA